MDSENNWNEQDVKAEWQKYLQPKTTGVPMPNSHPYPCPSCGRCPTCGRGNGYPYWYWGHDYGYQHVPQITYLMSN